MTKIKVLLLTIVIPILLSGCEIGFKNELDEVESTADTVAEPQPYPISIDGIEFLESPSTIVSLSPALTEIIYEFGEGDRVVGRGSYCDYPPLVRDISDVGSSARPDIDKIISLKPNVVLASTPIATKDVLMMEQYGIKTLVFAAPQTLDEFKNIYMSIGLMLNGLFTGGEIGEEQFSVISKACDNTDVVYIGNYIYITEGLQMAGQDTLEDTIFSCFGNNLAKSKTGYHSDESTFADREPDVILLNQKYGADKLTDYPLYAQLDAYKNSKIIYIDNIYFERPTARIVDMINVFISEYKGNF